MRQLLRLKYLPLILACALGSAYAQENFMQKIGVSLVNELTLKQTQERLILNGFSIVSKWGEQVYLAALYTSHIEKRAEMLLLNNEPMAMLFYFLQDDITPQMLKQLFTESIIVNNNRVKHHEFDEQRFLELQNLFTQNMNAGDILAFEYSPKDKTLIVYLNHQEIKRWDEAKTFFNVLLRTWIGKFPPSREFKKAILNFPI